MRMIVLAVAAVAVATVADAVPAQPRAVPVPGLPLRFETVFDTRGEPASLHFVAQYDGGGSGSQHRLELWRAGDRVRRTTDAAVDTFGVRAPKGDDFTLHVLDLHRRINTRIDRNSMYRMGNFTDWFDLTHGLRHPRGSYRLSAVAAPPAQRPVAPCDWYRLDQGRGHSLICWSRAFRVPLSILGNDGRAVWRIAAIDRAPVATAVLTIRDAGFVRVDAVADMARD